MESVKRVGIAGAVALALVGGALVLQRSARAADACSTPWWFSSGQWTWQSVVKDRTGREIYRGGYDTKLIRVMGDRRLVISGHRNSVDPACTKFTATTLLVSCTSGDYRVWPPDGTIRPLGPLAESAQQLVKDVCQVKVETPLY
jgi:hypothetical protein